MTETALRNIAEERAARLNKAGVFWSGTTAKNPASAKLTL